jgi:hypothetical protein
MASERLTVETIDERQLTLYRRATPTAKLAAVHRLNTVLIGLKQAQLTADHPGWTSAVRQDSLRRWWFGRRG